MRKLIFLALLPTMVVVGASSSEAASHYIRAGATGANDGSTWADAWTTFPSSTTYIRGDEYYVADGTYSGAFDFARGVSGTTTIKICKATISTVGRCSSAHGSDTGWQNTYGDGQALFPGTGVKFSTAYWIFDGVSGAGSRASTGSNPASYGFYFTPPNSGSTIRPVVYNANNIQVLHTAVTCPGASGNIQQFGYSGTGDAVTASQTYVNNCQVSHWNQGDDSVIENSYFGSHWSSSANHGVQVEQTVRPIFRNNIVTMCNPQCIEPAGDCFTGISNGQYYNNVFANVVGGNGVLKGVCDGAIVNTVMYGNTVINSEGPILYQNNEGRGTGSGNTVVNNLFYNCDAIINQSTGGPISHSYNTLFSSGTISETGVQVGTGDPFVNLAGGDFRLRAATNAGLALPAPFNTDLMGTTRGTAGPWTRGAYEFTDAIPPAAPTSLRILP